MNRPPRSSASRPYASLGQALAACYRCSSRLLYPAQTGLADAPETPLRESSGLFFRLAARLRILGTTNLLYAHRADGRCSSKRSNLELRDSEPRSMRVVFHSMFPPRRWCGFAVADGAGSAVYAEIAFHNPFAIAMRAPYAGTNKAEFSALLAPVAAMARVGLDATLAIDKRMRGSSPFKLPNSDCARKYCANCFEFKTSEFPPSLYCRRRLDLEFHPQRIFKITEFY